MAVKGRKFTFHGAFKSKEEAKARERKVHGFVKEIRVNGQKRYSVLVKN